jgi:hypothetical protein
MVQIIELPLEILSNIPLAEQELVEVASTCRQLNQIFTPYLYKTFHYEIACNPNLIKRFLGFIHTIHSRQDLAQHVQNVDLQGSRKIIVKGRMEIPQKTGGETVGRLQSNPARTELRGWEIITYFLKLLPQLMYLCIEAWPPAESPCSLLGHIFPNIKHVSIVSAELRTPFDLGGLMPMLSSPVIETLSLHFYQPWISVALIELPEASSNLRNLTLLRSNFSGTTLKHILRMPKRLEVFAWSRQQSVCNAARRSDCLCPRNWAIREALEVISDSVEHMVLNIRKPSYCTHFAEGMGSLRSFKSLKTLAIVPELLLGYKNYPEESVDDDNLFPIENASKLSRRNTSMGNLLPDSIQKLTLYTVTASPDLRQNFWPDLVLDIASDRRLVNLTHLNLSHECDDYCDKAEYRRSAQKGKEYSDEEAGIYKMMEQVCENAGILFTGPWTARLGRLAKSLRQD